MIDRTHTLPAVRQCQLLGLARYVTFYNQLRPHRALDGRTPNHADGDTLPARPTATSTSARHHL